MSHSELLRLSAQIVSAHAKHNKLPTEQLYSVIQTVYEALQRVGDPAQAEPALQEPAVPIKKSVFPGYIICLEDGKKLKMMKRHLANTYNMTPQAYREKWKLPSNYPMVAPDYADHRSFLAKKSGLGRKVEETPEVQKIPAGKRGRPAKPKSARDAVADDVSTESD